MALSKSQYDTDRDAEDCCREARLRENDSERNPVQGSLRREALPCLFILGFQPRRPLSNRGHFTPHFMLTPKIYIREDPAPWGGK